MYREIKLMDIPDNLEKIATYYDRVLSLLEKWNWLYKYRATELLLTQTLATDCLDPVEKLNNYSLNQLPLGVVQEGWPEELIFFVKECANLSLAMPKYKKQNIQFEISNKLKKCTSAKKQHEIIGLAGYVIKHCQEFDISRIIDIGSGLGYIDRVLKTVGDLTIVGVEADANKIERADQLNKELLEQEDFKNISYIHCCVDDGNLEHLLNIFQSYNDRSCLIGLHACGDLSPVTLRLFLSVKNINSLILMPCCYHRMTNLNSFPMSTSLKEKLSVDNKRQKIINTNLLRIAAESTKERWCNKSEESHMAHAFYVLARAIVEIFLNDYKYKAISKSKRCVTKQHELQWNKYAKIWLDRHTIINIDNGKEVCSTIVEPQLFGYWKKYCHLTRRIEAYTCLQVCLQSVIETLLVIDKLSFLLEEDNRIYTSAIRVTDPSVSPRSIAIIAKKCL